MLHVERFFSHDMWELGTEQVQPRGDAGEGSFSELVRCTAVFKLQVGIFHIQGTATGVRLAKGSFVEQVRWVQLSNITHVLLFHSMSLGIEQVQTLRQRSRGFSSFVFASWRVGGYASFHCSTWDICLQRLCSLAMGRLA